MLRGAIKRLRAARPLNYLATTAVRAACGLRGGRPPESVVSHLPRVGTVRARLPNGRTLRLRSWGDDFVANQVFWRGWDSYEPETTTLFYRLAARSRVTLDVGAHVGFYSLLAAHANPAARVVAFEPLPKAAARFRQNVRLNRLANVELVEAAAGEARGAATLFHAPATAEGVPCSSGLSERFFNLPFYAEGGVTERTQVPVVTLDDVIEERGLEGVDLIKIDTETTEPAVLAGAARTLERQRPRLVFEVLPGQGTGPAISRLLRPLGYTFYLLRDTGPERREEIEEHQTFWNYLASAGGWTDG